MQDAKDGEGIAARQCWECFRRRLVCDRTLPLCKKCAKAGKKCPGYSEQKPLKWVEPGKVSIRQRKKDNAATTPTTRTRDPETIAPIISSGPVAASEGHSRPVATVATEAVGDTGMGERIMRIGNKDQIKEVAERGQHWEAAAYLQSNRSPLAKIQRLLQLLEMNRIPSYDFLSDETCDVVQSVNYFNTRQLPDAKETDSLAPNPAIVHFPIWTLHIFPPAMHYTLVCLSLNHYVRSALPGSNSNRTVIANNRTKIYKYRGLAIHHLNKNVAMKETRSSDLTIICILMFMAMEVHTSPDADWRAHANGLKKLIDVRGGFGPLRCVAPHLTSALVIYALIVTFSNSLGPASHQISITEPLEQQIEEVKEVYSLIFPYILCPETLFIEIIRVNRLRQEVIFAPLASPHHCTLDTYSILARIEAFEPRQWAQPGDHQDDWQLIGSIYQSAIAVYCITSLQALTILPNNREIDTMRTTHAAQLLDYLKAAKRLKQLKKILVFPLCVLGVEAGYRKQQTTQLWIERLLEEHAGILGSCSPLKAREVLRRYWRRKKRGWDECFDEPFTTLVPSGAC